MKLQSKPRMTQKQQPPQQEPKGLKGLFRGFFKKKGRQ